MQQTHLETSYGRINVRDTQGTGPAVLLIHGNSGSGAVFHGLMSGELGQRYRMLAPDLPGHGGSADADDPARVYNIPAYAGAMIEVLGQLGAERPIVFGWSLGGHIGVEMLPRLPGIRGLFITGTPPAGQADFGRAFQQQPVMAFTGKEHLTEEEMDQYARAGWGKPTDPAIRQGIARTDGRARSAMIAHFVGGGVPDQAQIVAASRVPIAVVNGADEMFVDIGYLAGLRFGNLWEGRQHLIEGAGHAPFREKPDAFETIFTRFLDDVGRT